MAGLGKRKHTDEERRKRLAEDEARRQRNIKAQPVTLPTRVARAVNKVILPVAKETDRLIGQPAKKALGDLGQSLAPTIRQKSQEAAAPILDKIGTAKNTAFNTVGMFNSRPKRENGGLFPMLGRMEEERQVAATKIVDDYIRKGVPADLPAWDKNRFIVSSLRNREKFDQSPKYKDLLARVRSGDETASAEIARSTTSIFDTLDPSGFEVAGIKKLATVASKASKLLDKAGTLKNVVTKAGQTVNQADMLKVLGKARVIDETSTIVRTKTGALKLMTNKRAAQYVAKQEGADVLDSVSNVGRTLGFNNASEYASEAKAFNKTNKISKTDDLLRKRAGMDPRDTAGVTTKPFEQRPTKANITAAGAKIDNPREAAASIQIANLDDLEQAAAIAKQLVADRTPAGRAAYSVLASRIQDSGLGTVAARTMRTLQEFVARTPKGLSDELGDAIGRINKARVAAGKAPVELNTRTIEQLDLIGMKLARAPEGSLEANALMSEASSLYKREIPPGWGEMAGNWFISSILSGPATGVAQLFGYSTMLPAEFASRGLQRTLGNAATNKLFGIKSAGKSELGKGASEAWSGIKAMQGDLMNGTNSFADASTMERGAKNFSSSTGRLKKAIASNDPKKIAVEAGYALADGTERLANIFSNIEAPARRMFAQNKLSEITELAREMGEDLTDPKVIEQISRMVADEADFRFFTNDGALSSKLQGVRQALSKGGQISKLGGKIVMPFATVPANLLSRGVIDYSPLGLVKTIKSWSKLMSKEGKNLSKLERLALAREFSQTASRAALGFAIYGGAVLAAELGIMTFGRDTREKVADMQAAQRIPQLGFNMSAARRVSSAVFRGELSFEKLKALGEIQNNDSWMDYGSVQPLAPGVAFAGNLYTSIRKDPGGDWKTKGVAALDATVKGIAGAPLFTNFRLVGSAAQTPAETVEKFVGNVVAGLLTPGVVSFVAQLSDQEDGKGRVRETYSGNFGEGILNNLKNRVPGLRQDLPQAVDLGGNKVYNSSALASSLGRAVSPQAVDLPATVQVGMSAADITNKFTAIPSRYEKKGERHSVKFTLGAEELVWARATTGKLYEQELAKLVQDPTFQAKNADDQTDAIGRVYSEIKGTVDSYFVAEALGVTEAVPGVAWYQWSDMIETIRKDKNENGSVWWDMADSNTKKLYLLEYVRLHPETIASR